MTTDYNATIEYNRKADVVLPDSADDLIDALEHYHVAVSSSARGWLEVTITLPAETLPQASTTALAVVSEAVHRVAPHATPIASQVLTTEEFDVRNGMVPLPSLIGTQEAAEILGVSQQRVVQLVNAGKLSATRAGRALAMSRSEVEQFAERDRPVGRPAKRS
jgi:excisionase family DNA binding protein